MSEPTCFDLRPWAKANRYRFRLALLIEEQRVARINAILHPLVAAFKENLQAQRWSQSAVWKYTNTAQKFMKHFNQPLDCITEEQMRAFFSKFNAKRTADYIARLRTFLNFAVARQPVIKERQLETASLPAATKPADNELELRDTWAIDKLTEQKRQGDDLIALLARKLIQHYLYFQARLTGGPDNLDDIVRFADECRELIQSNLPLFMKLSAEGRNIYSAIDERVQK